MIDGIAFMYLTLYMYYARLYALHVRILLSKLSIYYGIHPRSDISYIKYVLCQTLCNSTCTYTAPLLKKKSGVLVCYKS